MLSTFDVLLSAADKPAPTTNLRIFTKYAFFIFLWHE